MMHLKKDNPQKGRLNLLNRESSNGSNGQNNNSNTNGNNNNTGATSGNLPENKTLGTLKLRKPIKPVIVPQQQGATSIKGELLQKPMFDRKSPFNRLSLKKKNTADEKNI